MSAVAKAWLWLACALGVLGCSGDKATSKAAPPPAIPVEVMVEKPTEIDDSSEYIAAIKSRHFATIQPQVEGQITKIYVKSGDRVSAGARLLEIDPSKQHATVKSQEAARNSKQANLEWTRMQLERTQKLFAAGVASKQELDQAQTAYDAAQADFSSLDAQVREQQVQLHYYEVKAPSDGVVGDIPVHVGDRVQNTTVLTTIDENRVLEAYISVPNERATQLHRGARVEILDAEGSVIAHSRVTFISPQVDTATQSVLIKAAIANPRGEVRSAQFVRARVIWNIHQGLTVPVVAVSRVGGQHFVFLAEQGEKGMVARQRAVHLGSIRGSDYVVLEGLRPGEQVIVSGSQNLADGSRVSVTKQG